MLPRHKIGPKAWNSASWTEIQRLVGYRGEEARSLEHGFFFFYCVVYQRGQVSTEMKVPVSKYSTSKLIMKAMIISQGVVMRWQRQSEAKGNLGCDPGLCI